MSDADHIYRIPKPVSGYDLKLELVVTTMAWELFGGSRGDCLELNASQYELVVKVAENVLAILDEFKNE